MIAAIGSRRPVGRARSETARTGGEESAVSGADEQSLNREGETMSSLFCDMADRDAEVVEVARFGASSDGDDYV